jgi:putative tryptophan/tyrosine transport system substrate-binding protein
MAQHASVSAFLEPRVVHGYAPDSTRTRRQALRGLAVLGAAWAARRAQAVEAAAMAVVYPDIGDPFREVFAAIVDGVRQQAKQSVPSFAIAGDAALPALVDELKRHDVRAVVVLGRSGLKAAQLLDPAVALVAGCVLGVPEAQVQRAYAVHSLAPDPALVFAQLRRLLPGTRRVVTVMDPQRNGWLLKLAQEAARAQRLEFVVHEADDLKRATRAYQEAIGTLEARRDALWLPQDATTVDDTTLLALVLQEAWQRGFALVSSNVLHVKRGALFALYPDNLALGRSLARSALEALEQPRRAARGMLPLRDVLVAANQRTAAHLGITLDPRAQRIDKLYPES